MNDIIIDYHNITDLQRTELVNFLIIKSNPK